MPAPCKFSDIDDLATHVTTFGMAPTFPESKVGAIDSYKEDIKLFAATIAASANSADLLHRIRHSGLPAPTRMSLLKLFRRCVCPACDTEMAKKIAAIPTERIVNALGEQFKPIELLKQQFKQPVGQADIAALSLLLAENDTRGKSGYELTGAFFDWFASARELSALEATGPRGAGRDIELSSILRDFSGNYPCDIVVKSRRDGRLMAVGFARYDSTRGGSQSDDRTGGNSDKVARAWAYQQKTGTRFRILFLADGPGLLHRDTLAESCKLDGQLNGQVRVSTLKLAPVRVTYNWLTGARE